MCEIPTFSSSSSFFSQFLASSSNSELRLISQICTSSGSLKTTKFHPNIFVQLPQKICFEVKYNATFGYFVDF